MATFTNQTKNTITASLFAKSLAGSISAGMPIGLLLSLTYATAVVPDWPRLSRASTTLTLSGKNSATFTNTSRSVQYLWATDSLPWQMNYPWLQDYGAVFDFLSKN